MSDEKVKSAEEPAIVERMRLAFGLVVDGSKRQLVAMEVGRHEFEELLEALQSTTGPADSAGSAASGTTVATQSAESGHHSAGRWRTDPQGRTLYLDDKLVGMLDTEELARAVVERMNYSESDAVDREKAKRGHEIEARMGAEEERDRLRGAVRNRESEAIAALAELDESNARVRELESQLAEVRERDAAARSELTTRNLLLQDVASALESTIGSQLAELPETIRQMREELAKANERLDLLRRDSANKTEMLNITNGERRNLVLRLEACNEWYEKEKRRREETQAEIAAEREKGAINRKARIVCETAIRWVDDKRALAVGRSTPWILAVEKELADDVQAYEWAVKEVPPVPAVAARIRCTCVGPAGKPHELGCPVLEWMNAQAEEKAVAETAEKIDESKFTPVEFVEGVGLVEEAPPPASAPVERLKRKYLAEVRGSIEGYGETQPVCLYAETVRFLLAAAERDLAQHEKEQGR